MSNQRLSSSPLSSLPSSQATLRTASSKPNLPYRTAQSLPFELLQHVQVYFEEYLLSQAFRFLFSLLTASLNNLKPVLIPPPDYFAVIATFCIHPSLTTRTTSREKWANANSALKYLRLINKTIGPVNAHVIQAYEFRKYSDRLVTVTNFEEIDDVANDNKLSISYADTDSIFCLAEDFWALAGWALNCSCIPGTYAARWDYYAPYLDHMLDVLETDWALHEGTDDLQQSLLWLYVKHSIGGNARGRRILRAIFADGSESSLNEFREVFRKELKSPKSDTDEVKKQEVAVDIDEDIYGDWMQEDESTTEDELDAGNDLRLNSLLERQNKRLRTRTPSSRRKLTPRTSKKSLRVQSLEHEDSDVSMSDALITQQSLGGPESIAVRIRLMSLLINVSTWMELIKSRNDFSFPHLQELYTLFVEFIRPLPLNVFQRFVMPSTMTTSASSPWITSARLSTLCEFILQRMIDRGTHKRGTFEPMTQSRLITDYLPFSAFRSTAEAQAKVSLLLESVLRHVSKEGPETLQRSEKLQEAFQEGVNKRATKAEDAGEGRKKLDAKEEDLARLILTESAARMKLTIDALEQSME